jgi:hypothetical protein
VALLSIACSDFFSLTSQNYLGAVIPHLAALYPTSIILLTALNKSHVESTLKGQSFSQSLQFAPPVAPSALTSAQSHNFRNDLENGDVGGESYPGSDERRGNDGDQGKATEIVFSVL